MDEKEMDFKKEGYEMEEKIMENNKNYHSVEAKVWNENVFSLLGDQWALVTAGDEKKCNTMTVSWGGIGILWGKPTATLYIRPQRYTKEFMDREGYVSLSFMGEGFRKELAYCGKYSGKDVDKWKECGFEAGFRGVTEGETSCSVPYVEGAKFVLICKIRAVMPMVGDALPEDVKESWYPNKDYHDVYYCEIMEVMEEES